MEDKKTNNKSFIPTEEQKQILFKWLLKHQFNPYPTKAEKKQLMNKTGLNKSQIDKWFRNDRVRLGMTGLHVNNFIEKYQKNAANSSQSQSHSFNSHQLEPQNEPSINGHENNSSSDSCEEDEKKKSKERKIIARNDLFDQVSLIVNEVLGPNASDQQINNLYESIQPILFEQVEFHVDESSDMNLPYQYIMPSN